MADPPDDRSCLIHVDGPADKAELAAVVAVAAGGTVDEWLNIRFPKGRYFVERWEDFDADERSDFPDGFLYFEFAAELRPDELTLEEAIAVSGRVLEAMWARGWAAVAVSGYEDQLPGKGGYRYEDAPWPSS